VTARILGGYGMGYGEHNIAADQPASEGKTMKKAKKVAKAPVRKKM